MQQPVKWRETIDPFSLNIKNYYIKEVLGYPHAGNDVFYVNGIYKDGQDMKGFLKVERQKTADIEREVSIMQKLNLSFIPRVLDFSFETPKYILTQEIEGVRLSNIVGNNEHLDSINYMSTYGELLAKIHNVKIKCDPVIKRDFKLEHEFYVKNNLVYIEEFLLKAKRNDSYSFIHGDCHYANILWKNKQVSGLLDFELSGYGSREYDLAWAMVVRPGQKFLKTRAEREVFLDTYSNYHSFCRETLNYYLVLFYIFFYKIEFKSKDDGYKNLYLEMINDIIL